MHTIYVVSLLDTIIPPFLLCAVKVVHPKQMIQLNRASRGAHLTNTLPWLSRSRSVRRPSQRRWHPTPAKPIHALYGWGRHIGHTGLSKTPLRGKTHNTWFKHILPPSLSVTNAHGVTYSCITWVDSTLTVTNIGCGRHIVDRCIDKGLGLALTEQVCPGQP